MLSAAPTPYAFCIIAVASRSVIPPGKTLITVRKLDPFDGRMTCTCSIGSDRYPEIACRRRGMSARSTEPCRLTLASTTGTYVWPGRAGGCGGTAGGAGGCGLMCNPMETSCAFHCPGGKGPGGGGGWKILGGGASGSSVTIGKASDTVYGLSQVWDRLSSAAAARSQK